MKVTLIGTGNLATHLAAACAREGVEVLQVWGRNEAKARTVAALSGASAISDLDVLDPNADLILLAVSDNAIGAVAQSLSKVLRHGKEQPVLAHLSGATPIAVFDHLGLNHYGVFWPLQSFRSGKMVDFRKVPVCINGSDEKALSAIRRLAMHLSDEVCTVSDEQRQVLHLAAVFVNNFTNHLLAIGNQLTDEAGVPFDLLKPLIRETVNRLDSGHPQDLQTGPAIRGDLKTIERHLQLLANHPQYQQLYALLSQSIARWKGV